MTASYANVFIKYEKHSLTFDQPVMNYCRTGIKQCHFIYTALFCMVNQSIFSICNKHGMKYS